MERASKLLSFTLLLLVQCLCTHGVVSNLRLCADKTCESEYGFFLAAYVLISVGCYRVNMTIIGCFIG